MSKRFLTRSEPQEVVFSTSAESAALAASSSFHRTTLTSVMVCKDNKDPGGDTARCCLGNFEERSPPPFQLQDIRRWDALTVPTSARSLT